MIAIRAVRVVREVKVIRKLDLVHMVKDEGKVGCKKGKDWHEG